MRGEQPAPADAALGVVGAGRHPLDDLDAGEDPPGILPAPSRAPEPFAQDRARDDDPRLFRVERAGQVPRLAGRPHQEADQRGEQVGRDRQPRPLGDVVDLADQLEPKSRPDDPRQQRIEAAGGPFECRRDQSRGDHTRLDQPEVVVTEVEQLVERRHILAVAEVDAGQPQDRLGDHPQARLDRRPRLVVALVDPEVDRDVQHPRPRRVIHPQKEDVRPAAVRQVEPHWRPLDQDPGKSDSGAALPL